MVAYLAVYRVYNVEVSIVFVARDVWRLDSVVCQAQAALLPEGFQPHQHFNTTLQRLRQHHEIHFEASPCRDPHSARHHRPDHGLAGRKTSPDFAGLDACAPMKHAMWH